MSNDDDKKVIERKFGTEIEKVFDEHYINKPEGETEKDKSLKALLIGFVDVHRQIADKKNNWNEKSTLNIQNILSLDLTKDNWKDASKLYYPLPKAESAVEQKDADAEEPFKIPDPPTVAELDISENAPGNVPEGRVNEVCVYQKKLIDLGNRAIEKSIKNWMQEVKERKKQAELKNPHTRRKPRNRKPPEKQIIDLGKIAPGIGQQAVNDAVKNNCRNWTKGSEIEQLVINEMKDLEKQIAEVKKNYVRDEDSEKPAGHKTNKRRRKQKLDKEKYLEILVNRLERLGDIGTMALVEALVKGDKEKEPEKKAQPQNQVPQQIQNNVPGQQAEEKIEGALIKYKMSLRLNNNEMGDAGAMAIAECLEKKNNIIELYLYKNNIEQLGAKAISSQVKNLKKLILSENDLKNEGCKHVAKALEDNPPIKTLLLNENDIHDDGAVALAEALEKNTNLLILSVDHNHLMNKGGSALADALLKNSTLTTLRLDLNHMEDEAGIHFGKALRVNKTLTILDVAMNQIKDAGAQEIEAALRKPPDSEFAPNNTLTIIDMHLNGLSKDQKTKMHQVFSDKANQIKEESTWVRC